MEVMVTTDILGNQVGVQMVTIRFKEWGAILQGRKRAIPRMVGKCRIYWIMADTHPRMWTTWGASYVHVP